MELADSMEELRRQNEELVRLVLEEGVEHLMELDLYSLIFPKFSMLPTMLRQLFNQ